MLKFEVRSSKAPSPCTSSGTPSLNTRCNSLSSLSSVDSSESPEFGTLKVHTENVRAFADYKTLRVSSASTVEQVISQLISKLKISARDPNLFELWMEVRTRGVSGPVTSQLLLPRDARPLELHKCHPADMSRFVLSLRDDATLVRVHDSAVCPQSNYKSILLAPVTTASEALSLLFPSHSGLRLFVASSEGSRLAIPDSQPLAPLARSLLPQHNILVLPQ